MSLPMHGLKVVECALYAFVPSAGAVLADWGADVVKIEHPQTGDPVRGLAAWGVKPGEGGVTYLWEIFNRGKRSVGIDLSTDDGHDILMSLVEDADIFITNFLGPARRQLRIEPDDLFARNPTLIYGRGTGQGPIGPDADQGGFDALSYWFRPGTGVAAMPSDYDFPVQLPGPAFGDIQSGAHLAGGIAAALFQRERTGKGCVVDVSLLSSGLWAGQANIVGASIMNRDVLSPPNPREPMNALANMYRTSDGRFIQLGMMEADRYYVGFCTAIGRSDLVTDERFADADARAVNLLPLVAELDTTFGRRPLAEWLPVLTGQEGPWSYVRTPREAADDEQAHVNGYFQPVTAPSGTVLPLVAAPAQFDGEPPQLRLAPEHAADTDAVLLATGRDWDELIRLKEKGVIS